MTPKVSVCIPAYNSERYIAAAVESVLAQTLTDLELVVVDDASADDTAGVVEGFLDDSRVRLIRNESNLGAVRNWNKAMAETRGEFVKLVCGDDVLEPGALQHQVAILERSPEAVFAAGPRHVVDENGNVLLRARGLAGMRGVVAGADAIRRAVRSGTNPFGEPLCVLMRRTAVESCGQFSSGKAYMIDLDYWCRLAELGPVACDPAPVGSFRVVDTSWSSELAARQATEAAELFDEIRTRRPDLVTPGDVRLGRRKAQALNAARRLAYTGLTLRRSTSGRARTKR